MGQRDRDKRTGRIVGGISRVVEVANVLTCRLGIGVFFTVHSFIVTKRILRLVLLVGLTFWLGTKYQIAKDRQSLGLNVLEANLDDAVDSYKNLKAEKSNARKIKVESYSRSTPGQSGMLQAHRVAIGAMGDGETRWVRSGHERKD